MIEIKGLRAGYRNTEILHGIDTRIPDGKITVIAGPNGCGKSTLLKTIGGIHPFRRGEVCIGGQNLAQLDPVMRARLVAFLPQDRRIPAISVERLVLHGRFPYLSYPRRYRGEDLEIARRAMRTVEIEDLAQRSVALLSGGQRQKAYIAMALTQDTPVILMDEPTTYLDIACQMQTMEQCRLLAESGKTVVMVLHDLPLALKYADHLVVMADGRILNQGPPDAILESGVLERAFGVCVRGFRTPDGWQYYYRER